MKKILIITPCYNEEESLPHLFKALAKVRRELAAKYQLDIVLVNDGSSDNTQTVIRSHADTDKGVYYIEFAANAGHQSAIRAGINAATGYDAAIMMDADMQHPPELIPDMIKAWEDGAKVVQMVRADSSQDVGVFKYATSRLYYALINAMSNLQLDYGASDFRLIDRSVIGTVTTSSENDLFLRGYFSWLPVSKATIAYKPNKRVAGVSKYTLRKMLDLAYKGILQFSEKPLQIAMAIGLAVAAVSLLYGVYLIINYAAGGHTVSGWTSLMVAMLFCFGVNFILLGIIGTYLAHSIRLQKRRPEFIVDSEKLPAA